jgi:hypothetical protein
MSEVDSLVIKFRVLIIEYLFIDLLRRSSEFLYLVLGELMIPGLKNLFQK